MMKKPNPLLNEYLAATGIKQVAIADAADISAGHMSAIVSGVRSPGRRVAALIERATQGRVPASSWDEATS